MSRSSRLLGFMAGFQHAAAATLDGEGKVHDIELPCYCLRHEAMVTMTMANAIRACMKLGGGPQG